MKKHIFLFLCALLLTLPNGTEAANLKVTGSWPSLKIDSPQEVSMHPSLRQVRLSVLEAEPFESWTLRVRTRGTPSEHSGLRLEIRRTGDGKGTSRLKGGEFFVPVGSDRHVLFRGEGDRFDIPLELKVSFDPQIIRKGVYALNIIFELEDSK